MEIGPEQDPIDVPVPVHPGKVPPVPVIPEPEPVVPEPVPDSQPAAAGVTQHEHP